VTPLLLALVVAFALVVAYMNGFHDASNAISTTITTRALRASSALWAAAVLNTLGALLGIGLLAITVPWAVHLLGLGPLTEALRSSPDMLAGALLALLITTFCWDLLTWWFGMPSSTWHAFFGAASGVALVVGTSAAWDRLGLMVAVSLVGPVISATVAYLLMQLIDRLARAELLGPGHIRFAQTFSASAVAAGHGLNDVRLPLAVVVIALGTAGHDATDATAVILMAAVAVAVGAGTLMGGHRIIRTLGRRLTDLTAAQGLAAESSAAMTMSLGVFGLQSPVSTSQALASSVVGAGIARGRRTVRWRVARDVLLVWIVTPLACAVVGAALHGVGRELLSL
jgi:PiT family inorganic phosphate transporter